MRPGQKFRLGRNCGLAIDGVVMVGVEDVTIRLLSRELDLTPFTASIVTTVSTHWTFEVALSTPDMAVAEYLRERTSRLVGGYILPVIVELEFFNGLFNGQKHLFTILELDSGEPLNGVVRSQFLFKQFASA
jgi:hypothetical protein